LETALKLKVLLLTSKYEINFKSVLVLVDPCLCARVYKRSLDTGVIHTTVLLQ